MAFVQRHSISWTFNLHRLQGLPSNVFVYYCCIYDFHRVSGLTMTSFVNMFVSVCYTCNNKKAVRMFNSQCVVHRLWSVGAAAAVVQFANINKGMFNHDYQSAIYFLLTDFTYLEGRDGELVVKELVAVDSHCNLVSSCRTAGRKYHLLTPEWIRLLIMGALELCRCTIFRARNCSTSRAIICRCILLLRASVNTIY